ncbi:glycosyltransferase [Gemmatimonas groenlandica]|uniref:Glycosyltransferase family 4 protein n=1 Tax=Gemmatimonas groenlandica TaxID=2732249 RepID=A0A6M4IW71_9BACT|nr:glycosyltransferase [Gemmatimonas groenlandica]QJR36441.1 glycosyltransferase family 4 protein [Gemmatimonas groenlandica]
MPSTSSSTPNVPALESAQRREDGAPRFHIPAQPLHAAWRETVEEEQSTGVVAELRLFLDAQLEAGDALVDVAPGFGFVSLSAVTAPTGLPSVFVFDDETGTLPLLQSAAREVGGWLDAFVHADFSNDRLVTLVADRIGFEGRVFVHADAISLAPVLQSLNALIVLGRVVAICLSPSANASEASHAEAYALLRSTGFGIHEMRDADGEPSLFATADWDAGTPVIAIAGTATEQPVSALVMEERTPAVVRTPVPTSAAPPSSDRFSFIAPYCRTGYGVVGAHLLREFTQLGVPVAYFPLGNVDRSIVKNDQLGAALARQGEFDDTAPSVRLSQQFDLALHVGRGPRIGFPIFELDSFDASERHHLERQDRLIVTCEWARAVLLENGIWRTPIDIVPLGVDRTVFHEHVPPASKRGRDTVFMSVGKLESRKGQRELLRAFEAAFSPKDAVQLVLICHNAFVDAARLDELLAPFKRSPMASRITLVTKPLPHQKDLAAAMAIADCAVFPARAEGWNLEALEMLAMGKRVIASACTAHTAFLTADNAKLVAIDALEESVPGEHYGRWAAWGDPQHEQLVQHLRDVHGERQRGELAVNHAGVETSKQFSWTASARALMASVSLA